MNRDERVEVLTALCRRLWDERRNYRFQRNVSRNIGLDRQAVRYDGGAQAVGWLLRDALRDRRIAQDRTDGYEPYSNLLTSDLERRPAVIAMKARGDI